MKKISEKQEFNFWRYLINFWSLLFFIVIIYDFVYGPLIGSVINTVATVYIGVLAIYVGNKEFERWYDKHQGKHPGELFIFLWTFIIFLLIIGGLLIKKDYQIPNPVVSSYIAVLTILVITSKSKQIYSNKNE
ncbi:MAG: hypothetical protein PF488_00445 [Patescibacteria group bacterium]|jgi:hypothetical protein|nr:hypothetical protein [Patescibacteria group bacterium]